MDLIKYIQAQEAWSKKTFGEGKRTVGVVKHIGKELKEIEAHPDDLMEWVDVIILAMDGAWRAGYSSDQIVEALVNKQQINFLREWPTVSVDDEPTEHVR